jgi:DNA helicase-2/ATP-dependent DNA helicase PcrA
MRTELISIVKDLLAILRWEENPRDALAGFRVLQLLPGIGPASAKKAMTHLGEHRFDLGALAGFAPRMRRSDARFSGSKRLQAELPLWA